MRGRILVVDHSTPTPDRDSGSASTFAYLRILASAGFHITFAPADRVDAGRYTRALQALGIAIAPAGKPLADVLGTEGARCDVLLFYRAEVAERIFDLARSVAPRAKILFHPVDLHFLRLEREAALSGDANHAAEANAMRVTELDLIRRADATIVVSRYESRLLADLVPHAPVHCIPILREPPSPRAGLLGWRRFCRRFEAPRGHASRRNFVFIGGYGHRPNVDAVLWFVREVWPVLIAKGYRDRFIIAGSAVPPEIVALASDRIEVRGYVADLASLFDRCRLSIAPLRYGGGIKGKIVSSLSYGVPVVATSIATEGMNLRHGQEILIADEPEAMAEEIVTLYGDTKLRQRISVNGLAAFHEQFSETAGAAKVLAVFDTLMAKR